MIGREGGGWSAQGWSGGEGGGEVREGGTGTMV